MGKKAAMNSKWKWYNEDESCRWYATAFQGHSKSLCFYRVWKQWECLEGVEEGELGNLPLWSQIS